MFAQSLCCFLGSLLMMLFFTAQAGELKPGDSAPAFELTDQQGNMHAVSDYRGPIAKIYRSVAPETHADQVVQDLKKLISE